jgi:hypothetical protein
MDIPVTRSYGLDNPALNNEKNPERLNPGLDPFDPNNGYNSDGASHYSRSSKVDISELRPSG